MCGIHARMVASSEETVALLERVELFSTLSSEELESVARVAVPRAFAAGQLVFKEGDEGTACYVVRTGRARALRQHADGRSITLAHFGPGEIFGEMAMFDGERRSATVETVEPTDVIAILSDDMHRLIREHPDIAIKLIAGLGSRLRRTNDRLAQQSFQTVQSRVAAVLAQLVSVAREQREAGDEGEAEDDVVITATQRELAQLAGSSRESASRFLATLERAGIITQGRGRLTVHDPPALRRYVY
jgi:CRP/FNR family transcriptional regulator, cyclic AMP receptor protein